MIIIYSIIFNLCFVANSNYELGDIVDDFNLKNVNGEMVALSDYNTQKGVILIFSCNTCPWVKMYESRMIELNDNYTSKGYPVVAINPNDPKRSPGDSFEEMKKRAQIKNYTFPYLIDETQEIAMAYGATNTPQVFLLNNINGKFKLEYIGAIDDNPRDNSSVQIKFVEDAIDDLIQGKEVKVKKAKAIGCTIKWKQS